jgi:tripartite-type tricarboxylate transporter receptor subunit TctC
LSGALFESRTKTDLLHVPYRGGGPALNDVMGGQVPLFFANVASSLGHIQSGRLRPLAVTSRLRTRALPNVPSMEESGIADFEVLEWNPILGPAGMSADLQARMHQAIQAAVNEPEVLGRIRSLSGEAFPAGQVTARAYINAQKLQWQKVIQQRGITAG